MVVDRPHGPDEIAAVYRLSSAPPGVHLMHASRGQEGPLLLSRRQLRLEGEGGRTNLEPHKQLLHLFQNATSCLNPDNIA